MGISAAAFVSDCTSCGSITDYKGTHIIYIGYLTRGTAVGDELDRWKIIFTFLHFNFLFDF